VSAAGFGADRFGWTEEALAVVARLRGWTESAIEQLELTFDPRSGRVGFPIRDATLDEVGVLHYLPDPAARNGQRKMEQPAGVARQLFPPPETLGELECVLLVEGEPDVVVAYSFGYNAVGVPGTAGWSSDYAGRFSGRRWIVYVVLDCDPSGRAAAAAIACDLVAAGVDARIVELDPGRDDGYDLTDFLRERSTDALEALLDDAELYTPPTEPGSFVDPTLTFTEFVARRDESTSGSLITCEQGTLLHAGGLAMLAAIVGHGKTTLSVELVLHAGAGLDYTRPLRVLVIENEGPREAFREKLEARLVTWEHDGELRIWDVPPEWGLVRISDPVTRERLRAVIELHQIDLILSDSLTRFGVRGNGTPEETREFVEWLTELGLGRNVAFLLLHHPRTRPEKGEAELERLAGAWQPHADLILLLGRLDGNRARLSFPKTRWTKGQPSPSILAFDPETESFSYVGVDEPEQRDYVAELVELMADGKWWTVDALRKPKAKGGVGAAPETLKEALADARFESVSGDAIGKRKDATYYRLREASRPPYDARDAMTLLPEVDEASPSPPSKEVLGGDASSAAEWLDRDAELRDAWREPPGT
jgi:AAA domain/Toprim domain